MSKDDSYEQIVSSFSWDRPVRFNFATDIIDQWARDSAHRAMIWVDDSGLCLERTYTELSIASKKLCNVLSGLGIKRGDVVVLVLGRNIEWWETLTACLRMGVITSPGTVQLSAGDLVYRINSSNAKCVVTDPVNAEKLNCVIEQLPDDLAKLLVGGNMEGWTSYADELNTASPKFENVPTRADEDALCYFTSGTTGYPKMCMHSHSYGLAHTTTGKYWLDLSVDDIHWNISDTGWAKAAWSSYFGPFICGATIFVHHAEGFNALKVLQLLESYPITTMCGAPTIYRMLVQEDLHLFSFESLRHCVSAGEPLNPEIIKVWRQATGVIIRDGYGQTETTILCGSFPFIEPKYGSMGMPAPGITLDILDDEGGLLSVNTEGDIAVRVRPEEPMGLFKEYRADPEKTSECYKGDWYITGDRAYKDEDGYFWFVTRADDVILSGGYRIGPFEVESALIEHDAVLESAVVSSPDSTRGEIVKAFVVLASNCEGSDFLVSELQQHVKLSTAPYKYPRAIEFVSSLPKTVSGKIRRVELRNREWNKGA